MAQEILLGQIAQCTVNWSFRAPKRQAHLREFMPSEWGQKEGNPKKRMTSRRRSDIADNIRQAMSLSVPIVVASPEGAIAKP